VAAVVMVSTQLVLFVDALLALANVERGEPGVVGRQNGRRGVGVASSALRPHRALHLHRGIAFGVLLNIINEIKIQMKLFSL
jgi:hypothetical protein